jgi:hypothetical protein
MATKLTRDRGGRFPRFVLGRHPDGNRFLVDQMNGNFETFGPSIPSRYVLGAATSRLARMTPGQRWDAKRGVAVPI